MPFETAHDLLRGTAAQVEVDGFFGALVDRVMKFGFDDAEIIYGVKKMIETLSLTVYVDWIEDAQLDRTKVTAKTAAVLRERMKTCSSLVYAHSANSPSSVWMPWELGYFDGIRPHQVWILPLVSDYDSEISRPISRR